MYSVPTLSPSFLVPFSPILQANALGFRFPPELSEYARLYLFGQPLVRRHPKRYSDTKRPVVGPVSDRAGRDTTRPVRDRAYKGSWWSATPLARTLRAHAKPKRFSTVLKAYSLENRE